jgi:hypothetical protein
MRARVDVIEQAEVGKTPRGGAPPPGRCPSTSLAALLTAAAKVGLSAAEADKTVASALRRVVAA